MRLAETAVTRERTLSPYPGTGIKRIDPQRIAFMLGFGAILLTYMLPGSMLQAVGLYSSRPGGNPLAKFHPATYAAIFGAACAFYGGRRLNVTLVWSVALVVFVMAYSVASVGIGGVALYLDTFLAAMFTTIALEAGSPRQRRMLGYTMIVLCVFNVALSIYEDHTQTLLLPSGIGAEEATPEDATTVLDEFRGQGFYGHPLDGALITALAMFMVLGMKLSGWRVAALWAVFAVGLLTFGGRAALLATLSVLGASALFQLTSGLATRRLSVGFLGAFIAGVFLLPALLIGITATTDLGLRISHHLYLDNSADVRLVQWRILSLLNVRDLLFGATEAQIDLLKAQVGLSGYGVDIENPWLLTFLSLGVTGFPLLMAALFLFLWHLGRRADTPIGWLIVITFLLICSTNNSLGRKVPYLVFLSGIMSALSGFSEADAAVPVAPVADDAIERERALGVEPQQKSPRSVQATAADTRPLTKRILNV